jgi:hypothetical protein
MADSIVTIINPPQFMIKSYLKEKLALFGYGDMVEIKEITKNQMPKEIELKFPMPELAQKFLSKMNNKSLDEVIFYPINIKSGPSSEKDILTNTKEAFYFEDYTHWPEVLYQRKPKEDGLVLISTLQIENQKRVMAWLIKKIGKNMLKGQSVMNISLPVYIFDKRTMLQVFAFELKEAPYILPKVYYIKDNIEKLKYVSVFFLSQIVLSPILVKPFNPIIGETYQAKVGNLNVYLEQTVHKPPTANFYCYDDDGLYKITGYLAVTAQAGVNCFISKKLGNVRIEFKDGSKYRIYYPTIIVGGVTMGKRYFNIKNCAVLADLNNGICTYVKFNPDQLGLIKGMFNKGKQKEYYPDKFIGKIVNFSDVKIDKEGSNHELNKNAKSYCDVSGEWCKEIYFGEQCYWRRNLDNYCNMYEMEYKLPSDSSLREDMILWGQNDEEKAQIKKEEYEELQRKDTKLRNEFNKQLINKDKGA